MHLDHFNSKEDNVLMSIDELRALRLRKQKIKNNKKARQYIAEINQRFNKLTDKNSNNFFKNKNIFRRSA